MQCKLRQNSATKGTVMSSLVQYRGILERHERNDKGFLCVSDQENGASYLASLKACAKEKDIHKGTALHADILQKGLLEKNPQLVRGLVNMYVKCDATAKATQMLEEFQVMDVLAWSAVINAYVHQRKGKEALRCFQRMRNEGAFPDAITFTCILKACGDMGAVDEGRKIHDEIMSSGLLENDSVLGAALMGMYVKFGALDKAQQVLHELPFRDVSSWNVLIAGYAQKGHGEDALNCFRRMQIDGISPDAITFTCAMKACGRMKAIGKGKEIHNEIINRKMFGSDIVLGNALVDMYAKCGDLGSAREVFTELPIHDVISWNALISGYAQHGQSEEALNCFEFMQQDGITPDAITLTCILKACGTIQAVDKGELIHKVIISKELLGNDSVLGNSLVEMYMKCGAFEKAQEVFNGFLVRDGISWNVLIAGYATQQGHSQDALICFERMQSDGCSPNANTFTSILKACSMIRAIDKGKQIHSKLLYWESLENHSMFGNALVDMYAHCATMEEACRVLHKLPIRDVAAWSTLMSRFLQQNLFADVLDCFEQMQNDGICPNAIAYGYILKACGSIRAVNKGKQIHEHIISQGLLKKNISLGNSVVDMYVKCGLLLKAQETFDELPDRDEVSWNTLITGYAQQGQREAALKCFDQLRRSNIFPNVITFICILKACGSAKAVNKGKQIHAVIINQRLLEKHLMLGNALMDMYGKCGELSKVKRVFDELPLRDESSWNVLITGYALHGQAEDALSFFQKMHADGLSPDVITYTSILKACGSIGAINEGRQIHEDIVTADNGLIRKDGVLGNALVDMYGKCGELVKAQQVFDELPVRDQVSWNALIAGYVQHRHDEDALHCFQAMQKNGLSPDSITLACVVKACGNMQALHRGQQIHEQIITMKFLGKDVILGNALIDMYSKCGEMAKAQQLFDDLPVRDIVSWNVLIAGYAQQGQADDAIKCYERLQRNGISPDVVTFTCILKACGSMRMVDKGIKIHKEIASRELLKEHVILGNALVDMYAKCGELTRALTTFDELVVRDVVSWNALIAGYVQHEHVEEAFNCAKQMRTECLPPDAVTFSCLLKACGATGALDNGRAIHDEIASHGLLEKHTILGNALVDMYAKCGDPGKAQNVFDELVFEDVVAWNALISGYTQKGQTKEVLDSFKRMQLESHSPDAVTFVCVLSSCSHSGLVDEGRMHFARISKTHGISPDVQHQTCMVDLFGRVGLFDDAMVAIKNMGSPTYPVWCTLLSACQTWGNLKLGKLAFEQAVRLDDTSAAAYMCMANIYADAGLQEDAEKIEKMRIKQRMRLDILCT